MVIALAHAWEHGKRRITGVTGQQGQGHTASMTRVPSASFNFILPPPFLNKPKIYLFCFAYLNYNTYP